MDRFYKIIGLEHIKEFNQMAFFSGPRQVGKTTIAQQIGKQNNHVLYLNWDILEDRELILSGTEKVIHKLPVDVLLEKKPLIIFDEIHKYSSWKSYVKGLFDKYKNQVSILVTGSARLDIYKSGGDSLMGRYFHYRVHPFSFGELCRGSQTPQSLISPPPSSMKEDNWRNLFNFGGFPDPFLKKNRKFFQRWQSLRKKQLFQEEVRDISRVSEISQMELLGKIISLQSSQLCNYSSLAKKVRVSDKTVRSWIDILKSLYFCFDVKPWTKNIARSLIKEPKLYLWDWSVVKDKGAKVENFVASHLLKSTHYWTDSGQGEFDLYFIKDKEKREVDFLVSKNNEPWILIEVKSSYKEPLSKNLVHFGKTLNVPNIFQLVFDLEYQNIDLFSLKEPKIVPMKTFLSQIT